MSTCIHFYTRKIKYKKHIVYMKFCIPRYSIIFPQHSKWDFNFRSVIILSPCEGFVTPNITYSITNVKITRQITQFLLRKTFKPAAELKRSYNESNGGRTSEQLKLNSRYLPNLKVKLLKWSNSCRSLYYG